MAGCVFIGFRNQLQNKWHRIRILMAEDMIGSVMIGTMRMGMLLNNNAKLDEIKIATKKPDSTSPAFA